MNETSMKINHLPSLTWHRLGINSASVMLPDSFGQAAGIRERGGEGIESTDLSPREAFSRIREMGQGDKRENYIAGKTAIYRSQGFATGLGGSFADYVEAHADRVRSLRIPTGVSAGSPLVIERDLGGGTGQLSALLIYAERGSAASVILTEESPAEAAGVSAGLIYVYLEEGAKLHLVRANLLGPGMTQLDDLGAILEKDASLTLTQLELGGARVFSGAYAEQRGEGSEFHVHTGYMTGEDHLLDLNYVAAQFGRKSVSEIQTKGVLSGRARKVFRGTIDFRRGSVGAVGNEQEDVLLLGDEVINQTIPVILCEEEDVDGRHGATIGNLSEEMLFYMGTRGIDREAAERIMVRGRLHSVAGEIPDEEIRRHVDEQIGEVCGRL